MPDTVPPESAFAVMAAMSTRILALCHIIQQDIAAQQTALRHIQTHLETHVPASE